jgi:OFA family oxalate/formate antiporter-like MFS transporter
LTAAGFGAGAALTVIPISQVIHAYGYQAAFFWFGLVQGACVFVLGWFMRGPQPGETPKVVASKVNQSALSYTPGQMLITPVFWLLYVMFVVVSASGLMATAQIAIVAKDLGVAATPLMLGATTLTVALLVDNVANGAARPLFGWISDLIGRENTMAIAFGLGGFSYWLLGAAGTQPWTFVICAGLIFLTWGEIFSLFPSTCTDTFGAKFATANLCFLYTAKGASAFFVPYANEVIATGGTWSVVFTVTAIMNFVVVALALFVLKPMRAHYMSVGQPHLGRLRRVPYFVSVLGLALGMALVGLAGAHAHPVATMFTIAIGYVVNLYLAAMRLNDSGWNGWWSALFLVPFLNVLVFIYLCLAPSIAGLAPSARVSAVPRLPA